MKKILASLLALFNLLTFSSCTEDSKTQNTKPNIVATTSMVADLVENIGKDSIEVEGLMGAGVDPHLYKASEGDVTKLTNADIIFYNGLHLEGKMVEIFEKMEEDPNHTTVAIGDAVKPSKLISSANFASNYDPHIWFSVENWIDAADLVANKLTEEDPESASYFKENLKAYKLELEETAKQAHQMIDALPKERKIMVTAHDAFNYFGQEFGVEVIGLQGISTATEAGAKDLIDLANFIVEEDIPAIFTETSVSDRTINALKEAVKAKGKTVEIGGKLYSDALGAKGTPEGTYTGMFIKNVSQFVNAMKPKDE